MNGVSEWVYIFATHKPLSKSIITYKPKETNIKLAFLPSHFVANVLLNNVTGTLLFGHRIQNILQFVWVRTQHGNTLALVDIGNLQYPRMVQTALIKKSSSKLCHLCRDIQIKGFWNKPRLGTCRLLVFTKALRESIFLIPSGSVGDMIVSLPTFQLGIPFFVARICVNESRITSLIDHGPALIS